MILVLRATLILLVLNFAKVEGADNSQPKQVDDIVELERRQTRESNAPDLDNDVRDQMYEIRDSASTTWTGMGTLLAEILASVRSQTTATSIYFQEIRDTVRAVNDKVDRLEEKLGEMEQKVEEMEEKSKQELEQTKLELGEKIDTSISLSTSVRDRQKLWMSEIRLISLYKPVDQNNPRPEYPMNVVTDGNFELAKNFDFITTHSHTATEIPDNKLWIELGGYFKIHRVLISNYRPCCRERLVGTHIYADEQLLGTVIRVSGYHDFLVKGNHSTYASTITLHQPLPRHIHVHEVQVWGQGPFGKEDIFA